MKKFQVAIALGLIVFVSFIVLDGRLAISTWVSDVVRGVGVFSVLSALGYYTFSGSENLELLDFTENDSLQEKVDNLHFRE